MLTRRTPAVLTIALIGSFVAAGCTLGGGAENDSPHDDAAPTVHDVSTAETAPAWVQSACNGLGYIDMDHVLAASYESNAGMVALWEGLSARLAGASSLSNYNAFPPDHPVAVCYVAGWFPSHGPAPLDGSTKPPYERAILLIPLGASAPLDPALFGPATMTVTDGPPAVDTPAAAN